MKLEQLRTVDNYIGYELERLSNGEREDFMFELLDTRYHILVERNIDVYSVSLVEVGEEDEEGYAEIATYQTYTTKVVGRVIYLIDKLHKEFLETGTETYFLKLDLIRYLRRVKGFEIKDTVLDTIFMELDGYSYMIVRENDLKTNTAYTVIRGKCISKYKTVEEMILDILKHL